MKSLILIIISVVVTFFAVKGYNSVTGTRAISDDKSDTRTLRKQYDDLVLINNDLDNTVKTQAKTIKDKTTYIQALKVLLSTERAGNNEKTEIIGKLKTALINSQEYAYKLKAIIKELKTVKKYKSKKRKKRKVSKKSVKSARQLMKEREYKKLMTERAKIISSLSKAYKALKKASGTVSRKHRIKSVASVNKIISNYKSKLRRIDIKLKQLK